MPNPCMSADLGSNLSRAFTWEGSMSDPYGGWQPPVNSPPPAPNAQPSRPWWRAVWVLPVAALIVGAAIGAGAGASGKSTAAGPTVTATRTQINIVTETPVVTQV